MPVRMELSPALVLRQAQDEGLFLTGVQATIPHPELVEGWMAGSVSNGAHNERNQFMGLAQERTIFLAAGAKGSRIDSVHEAIAIARLAAAFAAGQTGRSAQMRERAARDRHPASL